MKPVISSPLLLAVMMPLLLVPLTGHLDSAKGAAPQSSRKLAARIAFVRDFPRRGENFIFTIRPDGTGLKRLTDDGSAWSPAWSPDGTRIAFESKRDGDVEIFVMNRNGGGEVQLTDNDSSEGSPAWSPDGEWIAFASDAESTYEGTFDIYKMRSDGSEITRLTSLEGQEWTPTWSMDGSRIAFAGDDRIVVMNADGTDLQVVSGDTLAQNPAWAPNGSLIAFQGDHFDGNSEVHTMRPDGTGFRRLTRRDGPDQNPSWSPSSIRLTYTRDWNLAVMRKDGTRQRVIYSGRGDVYAPDWGPPVERGL